MRTFCIVLAVLILMTTITTTSGKSCYFTCLRELITCKRGRKVGCCDAFVEECMPRCGVSNAKCKGSKRGSWNKRFEFNEDQQEEYYPMF